MKTVTLLQVTSVKSSLMNVPHVSASKIHFLSSVLKELLH
jgi:hypothetical protein